MDLVSAAQRSLYQSKLKDVFDTFARPFLLYVNANVATISTSFTYSRFGDHSQNAAISEDNPAVTPQAYTVTGCIYYANNQPWTTVTPDGDGVSAQQLKLRESDGVVRLKVDATGYALMQGVKLVHLDSFNFQINSTPRPHGIIGSPDRWTYKLEKID